MKEPRKVTVADTTLLKIYKLVKANRDITINEIIGETNHSNTYIVSGLKELTEMGCITKGKSDSSHPPRNIFNVSNHNCFYCKGIK
jgi:predicted transcriptional regulator